MSGQYKVVTQYDTFGNGLRYAEQLTWEKRQAEGLLVKMRQRKGVIAIAIYDPSGKTIKTWGDFKHGHS